MFEISILLHVREMTRVEVVRKRVVGDEAEKENNLYCFLYCFGLHPKGWALHGNACG